VILDADVVFNVAKLKTHKKSGVTLCMKNLVGMNVDKNYLPHYRVGTPSEGGDELPDLPRVHHRLAHGAIRAAIDTLLMKNERAAVPVLLPLFAAWGKLNRVVQRSRPEASLAATHPGYNQMIINSVYRALLGSEVRAGNWEGNDTIWRMILDLNRCLNYVDREGRLRDEPARRTFGIIDGIVGGELDGPMNPRPKPAGVLLAGRNAWHLDRVGTQLMGFDEDRIGSLVHGPRPGAHPLVLDAATRIASNRPEWCGSRIAVEDSLHFEPHPSWPSLKGRPRS
jgi:hypothetical protein